MKYHFLKEWETFQKKSKSTFIQLCQFMNYKSWNELFPLARVLNFLQLSLFDSYYNKTVYR